MERLGAGRSPGDSGSFGVRVQVQSISGRPYVVLNAQDRPEYPDVFLTEPRRQELVSSMSGSASSARSPRPDHHRAVRPPALQQRSPEILSRHGSSSPVMLKRARGPGPEDQTRSRSLESRYSQRNDLHVVYHGKNITRNYVFRYLYEKQSSKFIMVVWSRSDGTGIGAEVSQVTSAGQQERSEVSGQVANAQESFECV